MATLALAANSTAIAAMNPFAAAGLGILASFIDNQVVFASLFGPDDPIGPKFAGVDVQGSGEDAPYTFCVGPQALTSGTVVWTKREYDIVQESQNGKGGPTVTTESFFTDVSYFACDTFEMGGIVSVDRMDLDAKVFFSLYSDVDFEGWQYSIEVVTRFIPFDPAAPAGSTGIFRRTGHVIIHALAPSAPLLTDLVTGVRVHISNTLNPINSSSGKVVETGTGPNYLTWCQIQVDDNNFFVDTPGAIATQQNPARFFQDVPSFSSTAVSDVTHTLGTFDQDPVPEIEEEEGLGVVPNYSGQALITLRGLALVDFGNRIPNATMVIRAQEQITIAEAIRQIIVHHIPEMDEPLIDVSNLKEQFLLGYSISGVQSVATMLQPLMVAFDIIVTERDGSVVFLDRTDVEPQEIESRLLGAATGRTAVVDVQVSEPSNIVLPKSVTVTYIDPEANFETSSTKESRSDNPGGEDVVVRLPVTMTAEHARGVARRLLWSPEATRQGLLVNIMPSAVDLHAGSVIRFTVRGKVWKMLINRLDVGADWSLEADGVAIIDTLENLPATGTEEGGAAWGLGSRPYSPPVVELGFYDGPPLSAAHAAVPGFYGAVASLDFYAEWLGSRLHRKSTSTDTYSSIGQHPREATMGTILSESLPPGNTSVLNRQAYVDVKLMHGFIQTVTEDELLTGVNEIVLNGEVMAFLQAWPLGFNEYRLVGLARGLRGTESLGRTQTAYAGDVFVVLDSAVKFYEIDPSRINQEDTYKAVALGGDLDEQPEVVLTHKVGSVTNTTVSHIRGVNGFNNEIIITWNRRSRYPNALLGPVEQPNHNNNEVYTLRIFDGLSDTILRTLTLNEPRWLYNGFDRNNDGNGSGSPFRIEIEQVGDYNQGLTTHAVLPTKS